MNYLKEKQYYEDLYDLLTIEDCLNWVEIWKDKVIKDKEKINDFELADAKGFVGGLLEISLYYKKGERYRDREKTINEWMEKDRVEQEKYDNAKEPSPIFCPDCNWAMEFESKTLYNLSEKPLDILFFFKCPKCQKIRGIFDNGEEFKPKRPRCPKCNQELKEDSQRKGQVITTIGTCKCGYKNKDVWDMKAESDEYKKKQEKDKQLLEKFKGIFCLSKEKGEEYISNQIRSELYLKHEEERKTKESDPRYKKAKALKKLKVFDLQKLLKETLEKAKYIDLSFDKPEITRDVIIPFSVQESDTSKSDYDSQNNLKKLIKKTLEDTNWRLMSDGICQRLGILTGKIRGYEKEEDLVKIIKISNDKT